MYAAEFFDAHFGESEGYVVIAYRDTDGELNQQQWFDWPSAKGDLLEFVEERSDEDLYTSPMIYSEKRRKKEYVKEVRVVYADADTAQPEVFHLNPTTKVQTSPGKWHLYWRITDDLTPHEVEALSQAVSHTHRKDGCDTGWALTKLLRIPGTINSKYGLPYEVKAEWTGEVYTAAEFGEKYSPEDLAVVSEVAMPETFPERAALMDQIQVPMVIDLLIDSPGPNESWYPRLWLLINELIELGFDADEIFALTWDAACNKYKRDGRSRLDLWKEIQKAIGLQSGDITFQDQVEAKELKPVPPSRRADAPRLLSDEERESLVDFHDFVEEYTQWASGKTDASPQYHRAAAFTILSTIFGEFCHVNPQFGKLRLNLWFLVLGGTTRSRKTTVRKQMLRTLDALETDEYNYDLGSDATTEGILVALADRAQRSSLFHRDEIQGMFSDQNAKTYLHGLSETFTELYDGHARGRLRAASANTKRVETNFVYFAMGIADQTAKILTQDDFMSGFLARFLWVIGESKERTRENEYLAQASPDAEFTTDTEHADLVRRLSHARDYWSGEMKGTPRYDGLEGISRDTTPIFVDDDAWQRYNDLIWDLGNQALARNRAEVLEPAADRLNKSTLKAAALLAMYDAAMNNQKGEVKVEMRHMLAAIQYTEEWVKYLFEMAEKVSSSRREQLFERVTEIFYATGMDIVEYTKVYAKFKKDMDHRQFKQLIEDMIEAGQLSYQIESKKKYLRLLED